MRSANLIKYKFHKFDIAHSFSFFTFKEMSRPSCGPAGPAGTLGGGGKETGWHFEFSLPSYCILASTNNAISRFSYNNN